MKIAALYDIHGNLPALEAVLQDLERKSVDLLVIGGDVLPGPYTSECLDLLLKAPYKMKFILGNCEEEYVRQMDATYLSPLPDAVFEQFEWVRNTLNPFQELVLSEWPATLAIDAGTAGKVLFCHGTPRNANEIFTPESDPEFLEAVFSEVAADIIVCGHTHFQFDIQVSGKRVLNAGSVGMAAGSPGAYWLWVDGKPELMHTPYDYDAAAQMVMETKFPDASGFVENAILQPPSIESLQKRFTRGRV